MTRKRANSSVEYRHWHILSSVVLLLLQQEYIFHPQEIKKPRSFDINRCRRCFASGSCLAKNPLLKQRWIESACATQRSNTCACPWLSTSGLEYFICISSSTGAPLYTWMIRWHFFLHSSSKILYSRRLDMRVLLKVAEWGGKEHLFSIDANKTRTQISTVNLRHSGHLGTKSN